MVDAAAGGGRYAEVPVIVLGDVGFGHLGCYGGPCERHSTGGSATQAMPRPYSIVGSPKSERRWARPVSVHPSRS
jgi:hypothetical protein